MSGEEKKRLSQAKCSASPFIGKITDLVHYWSLIERDDVQLKKIFVYNTTVHLERVVLVRDQDGMSLVEVVIDLPNQKNTYTFHIDLRQDIGEDYTGRQSVGTTAHVSAYQVVAELVEVTGNQPWNPRLNHIATVLNDAARDTVACQAYLRELSYAKPQLRFRYPFLAWGQGISNYRNKPQPIPMGNWQLIRYKKTQETNDFPYKAPGATKNDGSDDPVPALGAMPVVQAPVQADVDDEDEGDDE